MQSYTIIVYHYLTRVYWNFNCNLLLVDQGVTLYRHFDESYTAKMDSIGVHFLFLSRFYKPLKAKAPQMLQVAVDNLDN